ncbi:relA-associated inhibitor isoform X1 [Rana temporaria]|uniref:relA-associated inhibitor isoform X1 n=1 Tax=Rana temporaria TaxID=8407 RepID=UPI001AADBB51|nr:relA-associated inhibitor isoform X1 [Rana temporaria]
MVQTQHRPKLSRFGSLVSLPGSQKLRSRLWTKLIGWRDAFHKMAGDPARPPDTLLDLHFQSLAARGLNANQMELDSATAKLDELRWELEKRRSPGGPGSKENLEVLSPQNSAPSLSPSLARRSPSSSGLPPLATTSSQQFNWPRTQDSFSSSSSLSVPPGLTVTPSGTVPVLSLTPSPTLTRGSLPSDTSDLYMSGGTSRSPWGRPSSPRPQYYDRPASTTTTPSSSSSNRLSSGSYDYTMGGRSSSPVPEGQIPMPRYSDWTPPQRPPPAYEVPLGFAPPRFSDDVSSLRRRPPQRSWNESDLDMVYEKKPSQDRKERTSLGGVPVVKAWRESSLDPTPIKAKNDVASTLPRGYKYSSMDRGPSGMDRGPPGMDRGPSGMDRGPSGMDRGLTGMDRGPPGTDRGPPGMERGPPGIDRGPPGMERGPPGIDRGPPGMERGHLGPDLGWKSGGGTLPRSFSSQQPISRIPVPPPGGRGQPHRPLPLSMIFRLQNAFWEHQVPPQISVAPTHMSAPAAPPPSIPVIPDMPSHATVPAPPPPATEEVPRPLSPTRLQPHLPPQLADVQRVLEDIPRPLRRRGSQEHNSLAPPMPTDHRQYRQIMGRLFGRAAPKSSASEQPKAEEKLQGYLNKGSSKQAELSPEEVNFFKIPPIPEEPRPEERQEAAIPKPAEDPVFLFLDASESRVGATALLQGEVDLPVPVVVSGGQNLELRSVLKGHSSPQKSHPRRARLDPLILLLDGALTGELDVVTHALKEVNDPSLPNEEGITALHNAICGANFHIVTLLINSGANVNAADSHGWTPLHCAASCNDLQISAALVRHGAAIFATTFSDGSLAVDKCDPYREGYKECLTYLTEIEECMGETQSGVVYALWDYSAEFADELSVREGDTVTVLRKDGEGGTWWWAAHCGREGYVPRNYFGMYPRLRPQRSPL